MAGKPELVLHIGAHKTASSFLQSLLREDHKALDRAGLHVVHRKPILESHYFKEMRAGLYEASPLEAPSPEAVTSFAKLTETEYPKVLLTNEDMVRSVNKPWFYEQAAEMARFTSQAFRANHPLRVILYVRAQPAYLEAIYTQTVQIGRATSFERFLARWEEVDLSWCKVADRLADEIGSENVTILPYESIKRSGTMAFYHDFLACCGVDPTGDFQVSERTETRRGANRSYSGKALQIAHAVNPLLTDAEKPKLRKFLQENFSTATHDKPTLLSPEQLTQLKERYAEDNRQLFERHMPGWKADLMHYV